MIVEETNKYADKKIQSTTWKPRSREKSTPVDNKEFYFLGMIMLIGTIQKPTLKSDFSKNSILDTPIFGRQLLF
jgi:hypothetical protein